ncbi:hypothetical protein [Amycolatopsis sp. NPDC003861]
MSGKTWAWAAAAAVVTSGLGVAINIATDVKDAWWAWAAVAVLTVISAGVSVWLQSSGAPPASPGVTQHATASDNATIQQAGRDINPPR